MDDSLDEIADTMMKIIWDKDYNRFVKEIKDGFPSDCIMDKNTNKTLMMVCCEYNLKDFVIFLSDKNYNIYATDINGNSALHIAAYLLDSEAFPYLLINYRKCVNNINKIKQTALMLAAKRCSPKIVNNLIELGASVNIKDHYGNTAMHWSLTEKHEFGDFLLTFEKLFDSGASLFANNIVKQNVIDYLILSQKKWDNYNFSVTKFNNYLISFSLASDLFIDNTYDEMVETMINIIWSENYNQFIKEIEDGFPVDFVMNKITNQTLMMLCCESNLTDFVIFLSDKNYNIYAKDTNGNSALHIAAYYLDPEAFSYLLNDYRKCVNDITEIGQTALMLGAKRCSPKIVNNLIKLGADVNIKDCYENTAMHWCLTEQHEFSDFLLTFDKLFEAGASLFSKNIARRSVVDYMLSAQKRWDSYNFSATKFNNYLSDFLFENNTTKKKKEDEMADTMIKIIWNKDYNQFVKEIEDGFPADFIMDKNLNRTLMMECCIHNAKDFVIFLSEKNFNIYAKDIYGHSALHFSSEFLDPEVFPYLLVKYNRDCVDDITETGQTALMLAAKRCSPKIVDNLITLGADVNIKDYYGSTAMHWSLTEEYEYSDFLLTFEKLYEFGGDLFVNDFAMHNVIDYLLLAQKRWDSYNFSTTKFNVFLSKYL